MKRLSEHIYNGIWAFFLLSLAATCLILLLRLPELPALVEDFQGDSYDTILSVKWFGEYGPLGDVPGFSGSYSLFGNFPLLYAFLGSLVNLAVRDASLSAAMVYWATDIAIALLLWGKVLARYDWRVRAAVICLFLFDMMIGNFFPLGYRKRQQLAILIGLLMFLVRHPAVLGILSFAALLAQPFAGACVIALRLARQIEEKEYLHTLPILLSFLFAYPFYSSLLAASSAEPELLGCGAITQHGYIPYNLVLIAPFAIILLANRKKAGLMEAATLALLLSYLAAFSGFMILKDALPPSLSGRLLYYASMPCIENPINAGILGIALVLFIRGMQVPRSAVALMLLLAIINLAPFASYLLQTGTAELHSRLALTLDSIGEHGISRVKTLEVAFITHGGGIRPTPIWTFFPLQGYAMLNGYNLTFVDEYNMPPQLSKGGTNVPAARLPGEIFDRDMEGCRAEVARLKDGGVEGLLYMIDYDITNSRQFIEGRPIEAAFLDEGFLEGCGLSLAASQEQEMSVLLLYKIS